MAATELQVLKRRVAGFRTAFNNKVKTSNNLSDGVMGPPVNRAPVVLLQLQTYLKEVTSSYDQLNKVLSQILDLVITDDDSQQYDHYSEYVTKVTKEYEEIRAKLTITLAAVEKPIDVAPQEDSSDSDSDSTSGARSRRTRSPPPKSCTDLKPDKLQKHYKPAQFAAWLRKLKVWFEASRFAKLHISCQQEYLRGCVADSLMALIEPDIGADSPVFPLDDFADMVAIVDLLEQEITSRNPIMSRRYAFFQTQMSRNQTFSQYLAHLRDVGNFCDLDSLSHNGIIIFIALTSMSSDYEDLLDDVLKLDPNKLDLKTLIDMARTFETSESAKKTLKKQASTARTQAGNQKNQRSGNSGGASGGGSAEKGDFSDKDRSAQIQYRNELYRLKRCMKCAEFLSTEGHKLPCSNFKKGANCKICNAGIWINEHLPSACHKNPNNATSRPNQKKKKSHKVSSYKRGQKSAPYTRNMHVENPSSSSNDEQSELSDSDDAPAQLQSTAQTRCTYVVHTTSWSSSLVSSTATKSAAAKAAARRTAAPQAAAHAIPSSRCNFVDAHGTAWLPQRPKSQRKGSHPTPPLRLTFFQMDGNLNVPFACKCLPDTGSTISLFNIDTVKKYGLHFDDSPEAKSHKLLAANGAEMHVFGVLDLQAKYQGKTVHLDCLVVQDIGCNAFISWHDLYNLNYFSCHSNCNACAVSANSKKNSSSSSNKKLTALQKTPPLTPFKMKSDPKNCTPAVSKLKHFSGKKADQNHDSGIKLPTKMEQVSNEGCNPDKPPQSLASKLIRPEIPASCYVPNDSLDLIMVDFQGTLGESISKSPMPGPKMDLHFKKDIVIIPTRASFAIRTPLHLKDSSDEVMANLIENLVVERVSPNDPPSDWILSAFYVRKGQTNQARLVVDCTPLNKVIQRPIVPFLASNDILSLIPPWARWFCYLDARDAYFSVALTAKASKICTFVTDQGKFRALRGVQGLSSTNDEYLARVNEGFRGCRDLIMLIDDILIFSDNKIDLYANVRNCLMRCKAMNLTMGIKKLRLVGPGESILFGGTLVSSRGFFPDFKRTAAISEFPQPQNSTDVKSWLGLTNTLASYVPNLSKYTEGVRVLLKKGVAFAWGSEQEKSFAATKELLTSNLVRKAFDPTLPADHTHIYTDAAKKGLGAALMQVCPKTGNLHLIQCVSRSLDPAEVNYSTIELEMSALAFGILRCKFFLQAHPPFFQAFTDHRSLVGIMTKNLADIENPRLQRLREKLLPYSFSLQYLKGSSNCIADALSRAPLERPLSWDPVFHEIALCRAVYTDPLLDSFKKTASLDQNYQLVLAALKDRKTIENLPTWHPAKAFKNEWHRLSIADGLIALDSYRLVVPHSLQPQIIKACHSMHGGVVKTRTYARSRYYWPNMNRELATAVENCKKCQPFLPSQSPEPLIPMIASSPMQVVDTDMFESNHIDWIIAVDRYSGYGWGERIRNKNMDSVIKFLKRIFDEWGYPNIVFSDSAGCYTGGDYENFLDKHGIKSLHPSAKHPSSNPAEPGVKNIKRLAQKSQNELDFADKLAKFRRCPRADGFSPAFMMLDREPRDPFLPTLPQNEVKISKAFQQRLLTKIKRSSKTENRKSLSELEIGTLVLLQCPISKMWSQTGEILSKDDISGRSYWVKRHGHKKAVNRNRIYLKPLSEVNEPPRKKSVKFEPNLDEFSGHSSPNDPPAPRPCPTSPAAPDDQTGVKQKKASRRREPRAGSREPRAGSREPRAGSREPGVQPPLRRSERIRLKKTAQVKSR